MNKEKLPSLNLLAHLDDPFSDNDFTIRKLMEVKSEGRFIEWKLILPIGPGVSIRAKYRAVKAIISFANADGGFIIFGVDPNGSWEGLDKDSLAHFDPAKIVELVNGCIFPDIPNINCIQIENKSKFFIIAHVPPSSSAPHVTTKFIYEQKSGEKKRTILDKHAVYYRHGAKSDFATPMQHQKIVVRRTEFFQNEVLSRIKETPIPIPIAVHSATAETKGTAIKFARITNDPNAPAIRLTRSNTDTSGIFLHEELYDGLFEEINNVVDANFLISKDINEFLFGEQVYYRIYAERQHISSDENKLTLLARTGLDKFYAPCLYWFTRIPANSIAEIILEILDAKKNQSMYALIKLLSVLGFPFLEWINGILVKSYHQYPQKPQFYWHLQNIIKRTDVKDSRLLALKGTGLGLVYIPDFTDPIKISQLLKTPSESAGHLSRVCMSIFKGEKSLKPLSRIIDIIAYGNELNRKSKEIIESLQSRGVKIKQ